MSIIRQVEQGILDQGFAPLPERLNGSALRCGRYKVIADRREAIALAIKLLNCGDILLVAGKGHETYQEMNGRRYPFDDRKVIREELAKLTTSATAVCGDKKEDYPSRRECR
jgi:UDP-N-acetylmuramyl tripeptide synthase